MNGRNVHPGLEAAVLPELELRRSRRTDKIIITITLMLIGWYAGHSLSNRLSLSSTVVIALSVLCSVFGAVLAAYLARRLANLAPDDLLLRVSADGLALGFPTSLTLSWDEIDQVKLIRSSYGQLPMLHLQVITTPTLDAVGTRRQIMHHLGVLWDRRSQEVAGALDAFRPYPEPGAEGQEGIYSSERWTGLRGD
jgi:hypothetical protein